MKLNRPRRRATRLRRYDYRQPGAYFVTICVQNRKCVFGEIVDGQMQSNEIGKIVIEYWNHIPQHFSAVELGEYVIMPNHIHGIIVLGNVGARGPRPPSSVSVGARSPRPHTRSHNNTGVEPQSTQNHRDEGPAPTLGQVVAYFKYQSTKYINQRHNTPGTRIWQRNYYDHVIRDDIDLQRIHEYIMNNPMQWELDQLHPDNPSKW